MKIEQLHLQAGFIQKLAGKGAENIAALKDYLVQKFPEHFTIVSATKQRLEVNFYGLRLVFRTELLWGLTTVTGRIIANVISEDGEEASLGAGFPFDSLGKVGATYTRENFSSYFLEETFAALHKTKVMLRP